MSNEQLSNEDPIIETVQLYNNLIAKYSRFLVEYPDLKSGVGSNQQSNKQPSPQLLEITDDLNNLIGYTLDHFENSEGTGNDMNKVKSDTPITYDFLNTLARGIIPIVVLKRLIGTDKITALPYKMPNWKRLCTHSERIFPKY